MEKKKLLLNKFYQLDERDEVARKPRFSRHQETGELTLIGIVARKQPRHFYDAETAEKHRLLMVKLVKEVGINGVSSFESMEFPYSIIDLEDMWELMFDVWSKEWKIRDYVSRFLKLIRTKLMQRKLSGFAESIRRINQLIKEVDSKES